MAQAVSRDFSHTPNAQPMAVDQIDDTGRTFWEHVLCSSLTISALSRWAALPPHRWT